MQIWSQVSHLLWREAEPLSRTPAPAVSTEGTGAPVFLRKAVRFLLTGVAATLLTAQIVGIRLAAPVDASGGYPSCFEACDRQYARDVAACSTPPPPGSRYRPPSYAGNPRSMGHGSTS